MTQTEPQPVLWKKGCLVRQRCRHLLLAALTLLLAATDAHAQAAWDSPMLLAPGQRPGFGVFLMDVDGGGIGVMGMFRSPVWNYGLRAGIADSPRRDGISVFGGIDYSGMVTRATPNFPLDVDWVFGAGLSFDERVRVGIPLGLTLGRSLRADNAVFTPYLTPRVVFDAWFGGDPPPARSSRLGLAADLGLDLDLTPAFLIRFAVSFGRRDALAIGLHF